MCEKILYWASTTLGVLSLAVLVTNVSVDSMNRKLQDEANQRQAAIMKANNMGQVNQGLAQALAEAAVKKSDGEIRSLLKSQGITLADAADAKKKP
ncbi:MAG: hypothetical protein ABTQ34_04230 [Bdellovibrionales bacterium]